MKKTGRLLAILIMAMMVTTPFMSFATEEATVDMPEKGEAVVSEETAEDPEEVKPEEAAVTETAAGEDPAPEEAAEVQQPAVSPEVTEPTKVSVAKSAKDLANKSETARDNDAFFTIDASKKSTSADLATDEIQQEVKDILKSSESASDKQTEIAETLQDSGYYSTTETGKTKVDVTSKFAFQRLRLVADKAEEINAYGASKAVYYDGYYLLSYDSMEDAKTAYDALREEYGADAVMADIPFRAQVETDWGARYMYLDEEKELIDSYPDTDKNTVKVAVLDTGINARHEVFEGKTIINGGNFISDDYYESDDIEDDKGHGTAVAGIIAQSTSDNVQIMVYKVLDSEGYGSYFDVFNALRDANNNGAHIINLSLGGIIDESDPNNKGTIKYMKACDSEFKKMNALIIAASGNDHQNIDAFNQYEVPGEFESTLCVGAFDSNENRCQFSNYGNALDFAAPGQSIHLAYYKGNDSYYYANGTSFATPYVASAAACIDSIGNVYDKSKLTEELKIISKDLGDAGKDREFGNGCPIFSKTKDFAHMTGLRIITEKDKYVYTGDEIKPSVTVKLLGTELTENVDYTLEYSDNIDAGTGRVAIIGTGDEDSGYYGRKTQTFTITPKKVTPSFTVSGSSFSYTGSGIKPQVSDVKADGEDLIRDRDYTVTYSSNVYPGRGSVTVNCKGNYSGSASKGFSITGNIANTAVSVGSGDYTGGAIIPGVGVSFAGRQLGNGSDYIVSYSNNVYIGTGYATITGKGYYSGSVTVPFRIGPKGTACKKMTRAKKAVTVKWAKQKSKMPKGRISGYQIQVSSDPGFVSNVRTYNVKGYKKTSKKVSKLARKTTYYARVRTYVKYGGDYYFSGWSNVRAAKTR